MPVEYPASLPPPRAFPFTLLPRRAITERDSPVQIRARSRDAVISAKGVTWRYSPEEFEIWREWYNDELLNGQRWFVMPLPGYLGEQPRVCRFVTPATRDHIASGHFDVQANLQIRTRSALPSVPSGAVAPVIGWLAPIDNSDGLALRTNSGSAVPSFESYPQEKYAGVVGYTTGVVVWSSTWAPISGGDAPVLDVPPFAPPGVVRVTWPAALFDSFGPSAGLLTVTATVDGVSVGAGQGLVMAGAGSYTTLSWGPQP